MSRKTELAKNTAILTVGKLCTQCISFFLLPLYTAILSTEEYGTFDLLVTYSTLLLPLVNWQLDQGLFRFMLDYRGNKEEQGKLFSTLLLSSTIQSIIYIILFVCVEPFLKIQNAYFLLLYVVLHVYTALFLQFVRGLGDSVKYTIASFISASATTVLNVIALAILKMGLQGLFLSTLIAQFLTLLYLVFTSRAWEYFSVKSIRPTVFKRVGAYSIPLIPNNLAWWVVNASDRTIIAHFLGTAANGIIITLILCYELISMLTERNNLHDVDTWMFFKYFVKMWIAVYLVSHTFDIAMAVFDIGQSVVNSSSGIIRGNTAIDISSLSMQMQAAMATMAIGELVTLALETLVVSWCLKILSVVITVIMYGRMIEIYLYTSLAPIPFATMSNREWGHVGTNYFRGLFALAFQAFLMMVCVAIYAALIGSIRVSSDIHSALFGTMAYTVILCFSLLKTGSLSKQIFGSH